MLRRNFFLIAEMPACQSSGSFHTIVPVMISHLKPAKLPAGPSAPEGSDYLQNRGGGARRPCSHPSVPLSRDSLESSPSHLLKVGAPEQPPLCSLYQIHFLLQILHLILILLLLFLFHPSSPALPPLPLLHTMCFH